MLRFYLMLSVCFIVFIGQSELYAQTPVITGIVKSPDGNPVSGARVVNSKKVTLTTTDETGAFTVKYKTEQVFGVIKDGFEERWFQMDRANRVFIVQLNYKYQELEEVIVDARSKKDVMDYYSINVIDYMPVEFGVVALIKEKGDYRLRLKTEQGMDKSFYVYFKDRPKEMVRDCMGNIHVLGNDYAYQIYVNADTVQLVERATRQRFEETISPCVAAISDTSFVMKALTDHNQRYTLTLHKKGEEPTVVYEKVDMISLAMAQEDALLAGIKDKESYLKDSLDQNILSLRRELREVTGQNPDVALAFMRSRLGDTKSSGGGWGSIYSDYLIHSYPIKIRTFQIKDHMVAIDFEDYSFTLFRNSGEIIHEISIWIGEEVKEILQDEYSGRIYLYTNGNGNKSLYQLDVNTGKVFKSMSFKEFPFVESIRVYNGWVYFREIENSFFKVRKLKMSVWEEEAMNE